MKEKRIIYLLDSIIISPVFIYAVFNKILPSRLIIHFGPGAIKYTSAFNAMVLVPILCIVLQQIIIFRPDWIGMSSYKKRIYYIPILMIVYYFLSLLLSNDS